MIFSATTGILIALMVNSSEISFSIGIGVGVVIYGIQEVLMTYVYKLHNPQLWIYGLMIGGICVLIGLWMLDLKMMITKRNHYYDDGMWFNGMIDLHTDLFFIMWRDLFTKEDSIDTLKENGLDS